MKTCCFTCKKYSANKNTGVKRFKPNRLMVVSNYADCGKKKLRFIRTQEASRLRLH